MADYRGLHLCLSRFLTYILLWNDGYSFYCSDVQMWHNATLYTASFSQHMWLINVAVVDSPTSHCYSTCWTWSSHLLSYMYVILNCVLPVYHLWPLLSLLHINRFTVICFIFDFINQNLAHNLGFTLSVNPNNCWPNSEWFALLF